MSPYLSRSAGWRARQHLAQLAVLFALYLGAEPHGLFADALLDDDVEADEGTAADKQDVRRVHLDELLVGMLAAALGRDARHGPFNELEEGLLHTLARNVAGDGGVFRFPADLVDLVDVHDAPLGALDVVVRVLEKLEDDVLNVFAHVARLGEGGGVGDGERHVEDRASVWARRVLPVPVGPMSRILLFWSSTSSPISCCTPIRL